MASLVAAPAGCSLFTDLGGVSGAGDTGDAANASAPDGSTNDGEATDDGSPTVVPSDGGNAAEAADAGGDALAGTLSRDGFETGALCSPWATYHATSQLVTDAYSGAQACKVCLTTTGTGGGIQRSYGDVAPGAYSVSARVKNVSSTDYRITIERELPDAAMESTYSAVGSFGSSTGWLHAQYAAETSGALGVRIWFGGEFKAGDCALVDEVIVTKVQ